MAIFPNPERYGFVPTGPDVDLPIRSHVRGMKPSPFISASRLQPFGPTRIAGSPFWIDEARARAAGARFYEIDDILDDLRRVRARTRNPAQLARIENIICLAPADREVLIRGSVPATAIKGPVAMGATRLLQGVQVVGFTMTAVDLGRAGRKSHATRSARPLAAETVRQIGGWTGAWAGIKIGGAAGVAVGVVYFDWAIS